MNRRMPAEWEPQDAILFTWPSKRSDWARDYEEVALCLTEVISQITRYQMVWVITADPEETMRHLDKCSKAYLHVIELHTNDTWARDYGAISVLENDQPRLVDFSFNGWGGKFEATLDNGVNRAMNELGLLKASLAKVDLVLEGGSLETDGQGTLLLTRSSVLHPNRNGKMAAHQMEALLAKELGIRHFLWLDHGHLIGDDTDGHIDTLVRFAGSDTLLYVKCDDPTDPHFQDLALMEEQLRGFRSADGQPFKLIPLPMPEAIFDHEDGHRLPATYANFLITNQQVLVPVYLCPTDDEAIDMIRQAFTDKVVFGINCRSLINQHGSLHCMSMQYLMDTLATP